MSRKSKNDNMMGNPSSIANAMYDAQKKEITSSMVLSFSFIAAGLIVAVIGLFQYFNIKSNLTDSSENIDAMAWVVIAAVGLLVGIIGLISIMKSVVSLGQIGKWAKEAESHASPFQGQKLNRKVAAMNQSQSMQQAPAEGMAEGAKGQKQKLGFFKRGKETKGKQNSDELYYKYNPQEKKAAAPAPRSAPMMEQKFDYGIDEYKKTTFADEFLKKNKRDPFAEYRKELGIKEEVEETHVQKPKFIVNHPTPAPTIIQPPAQAAVNTPAAVKQESNIITPPKTEPTPQKLDLSSALSFMDKETEEHQSAKMELELQNSVVTPPSVEPVSFMTSEDGSQSLIGNEETKNTEHFEQADYTTAQNEQFEQLEQFEQPEHTSTPYGLHNEADDDMFFSARSTDTKIQQHQTVQNAKQKQPVKAAPAAPNLAVAMAKAEKQKAAAAPSLKTVMLDLDYKDKKSPEEYDFSLFEEIDKKHGKASKTKQQNNEGNEIIGGAYHNESSAPQTIYANASDYDDNMFFTASNSNKDSVKTNNMPTDKVQQIQQKPQPQQMQQQVQQQIQQNHQPQQMQQQIGQNPQQEKSQQNKQTTPSKKDQTKRNKAPKTTIPPNTRMTKRGKKSFSETFLSRNGSKAEGNSEIVKNGTKAQRKFVDASEYDEWSCPQCGKVNQEYVGICACGARKPRPRKH